MQRVGDERLLVDATDGAVAVTLLGAGDAIREVAIKRTDGSGNSVTISAEDGETVDGATSMVLDIPQAAVTLLPDSSGSRWLVF